MTQAPGGWDQQEDAPLTLDDIQVPEDAMPWQHVRLGTGEVAADLPWDEAVQTDDLQARPLGTADQLAQAKAEAEALAAKVPPPGHQAIAQDEQVAAALARFGAPEPERVAHAATWLNFTAGLFLCRVLGQGVVLLAAPWWLPPMAEWYSGLLPYPLLLPCQVAILAFMAWANWQTMRGDLGWWKPKPKWALGLAAFAALYAGGMLARYFISGHLHPERRWLPPGSIPILFHFVLAGYVAGLAWVFSKREAKLW